MNGVNRPVVFGAAGVVVAMVLAWWFLLWGPRNRSYNDANAAAQQAQAQVAQLQAQYSRLLSIKRQLPQLQAELAKLDTAVPDQPQLDQIILSINDAAVRSGVQLLSIAPAPPSAASRSGTARTSGAAPPAIQVSLSLKGGYDQVLDFINRLDGLPRLLVIDTLGLTSNASGPATGAGSTTAQAELNVSMAVRLFTTTAQPAAGSTTTTAPAGSAGTTTTTVPGGGAGTATTSTTAPTTATTSGTTGG